MARVGTAERTRVDTGVQPSAPLSPSLLPKPKPPGLGGILRRLFLGDPLATSQLHHQRLGRASALAVFGSDMLSSVAYATEEMLRAMVPVIGVLAFSFVLPVSLAVAVVLILVMLSYRQTIKAYPSAGGAYTVSRENLGKLPSQIAAYALLSDYILTVAVSTAAGVFAVTSFFPAVYPYRVALALTFVAIIAWGNLRGVRESGRLFSFPAYFFIVTVGLLLVVGILKLITGQLDALSSSAHTVGLPADGEVAGVGIFLLLKAFASGGAAATGIEAVSNGISAFRPPEWKHARQTLTIMVLIATSIFLGIGTLAWAVRPIPDPDEKVSVLAMLAQTTFGSGTIGKFLFGMVQLATALVLIFAANTSFADFPRLASTGAADLVLPRVFMKRGYRLNFSNGILILAVAAAFLLVVFQASVHRLIPLYAIGVFTSITLSQIGMSVHHLRIKEPGWQRGLAINGLGAAATGVVAIVIAAAKFTHGAWIIIAIGPLFILWMSRVSRHYRMEMAASRVSREDLRIPQSARHIAVVLAERIDPKLVRALEFAVTIRPDNLVCVHLGQTSAESAAFAEEWATLGPDVELTTITAGSRKVQEAAEFIRELAADPSVLVTVVVPSPFRTSIVTRFFRGPLGYRISRALRREPNINVCVVRELPGAFPETTYTGSNFRFRISPRPSYRAVIAVDRVDKSLARAIRYARAIKPFELECVHIAADPGYAAALADEWIEKGIEEPLEIVGCEDRDVGRAFYNYLAAKAWNPRHAILLVMPRRDYPHRWHVLLHDRTRRRIASAVATLRNVYVVSVPYFLGDGATFPDSQPLAPKSEGRKSAPVAAVPAGTV